MSHSRIVFHDVWKKFHRGELHDSLRDLIPATIKRITGRGTPRDELDEGDFWAVRDLSFEVLPGQVLGIIGANGSGKSTSLKMLTKILRPTRGWCDVRGRVGALIEVAAGFHGDLTGRENIYLQGAIMGMRLKDITRKFDDIVDFSGVTEFIDTPVKRYSSGMSARLGFSIAAHLDPDVLIIDEVLAVGDFLFQERAFGRIKDLARSGIPVVIVSHQLERVADLCTEVIVLERGVGVCRGPADEAIAEYVRRHTAADTGSTQAPPVEFRSVQLVGGDRVPSGGHVTLRVDGVVLQELGERIDPLRIRVRSLARGEVLFVTGAQRLNVHLDGLREFSAEVRLQANLAPGSYLVELCAYDAVSSDNVAFAPSTVIHVTDVGTFRGSVQLNPEMTLVGGA